MVALLGTASDAEVAGALGLPRYTVKSKRRRMGIPPFYPPPHDVPQGHRWRSEEIALLGKVPDSRLAKSLGISTFAVANRRQRLRIAPFTARSPLIEWTPEKIELLGKAPDRVVAEELGISHASVLAKRRELGIPATRESHPVERNEQVAELLLLPNVEVVRRTGLEWTTVQRLREDLGVPEPVFEDLETTADDGGGRDAAGRAARAEALSGLSETWRSNHAWEPDEITLVGTAPDAEIARRLKRTTESVASKRRQLRLVQQAPRPWEEAEVELLGSAPDPEVAEQLGRSLGAVRDKRASLGISAFHGPSRRWRPHEAALLGTAPDVEIAERLGRSWEAVSAKRRKLGIPTFARATRDRRLAEARPALEAALEAAREAEARRRPRQSPEGARPRTSARATPSPTSHEVEVVRQDPKGQTRWSEEHVSLLGEVPDAELGRRMGVHPRTVARERDRRAIPPFNRSPNIQWTPEMILLLGRDSDRRVAEELGIGIHSVAHKRLSLGIPPANPQSKRRFPWTPEQVALLGTRPDADVGRRLGLSGSTVGWVRRSRGIAPFVPEKKAIQWTEDQIALLGTVPDKVLAEKLGVSRAAVSNKRRELGIPGQKDNRPVAVTPELRCLLELPTNQVRRRTGLGAGTIKNLRDELGIRRLTVREWRIRRVEDRLGKVPDEILAEELGVSPRTVAKYRRARGHYQTTHQRWTPEEESMLGELSDEEVARRTGHTVQAVANRRSRLGYVQSRPRRWTPEEVALLGKLPDREVAKRTGRTLAAVQTKRYALGLASSDR